MKNQIISLCTNLLFVSLMLILSSCSTKPKDEVVNIEELLPKGALTEITNAWPDFMVTITHEENANVSVMFGDKYLRIEGIEEEEKRERLAKYVLKYLENPNKRAEDKAKREAYEKLPPKEKMAVLIKRIKKKHPNFSYQWVGLGAGNVKAEYGDNSLLITDINNDGAREEWAYAIMEIQKQIDKTHPGEGEGE